MAQHKQAKVLSEQQVRAVLKFVEGTRYPLRDRVMVLLSVRAGFRAKEIASLTWGMCTDAEMRVSGSIELPDVASKGRGGRTVPISRELHTALSALQEHAQEQRAAAGFTLRPADTVVISERGGAMTASSIVKWFERLYTGLGFDGCSSHSGRRTAITAWAKGVARAGGSMRDVQELAGHSSLQTTQRYVQGDTNAKRNLINMVG